MRWVRSWSTLLLAACAQPQPDTASRIDALMRPYAGAVPGASVLVLRDGVPVFRRAYGRADLEEQVAATPATNYRLASTRVQLPVPGMTAKRRRELTPGGGVCSP